MTLLEIYAGCRGQGQEGHEEPPQNAAYFESIVAELIERQVASTSAPTSLPWG